MLRPVTRILIVVASSATASHGRVDIPTPTLCQRKEVACAAVDADRTRRPLGRDDAAGWTRRSFVTDRPTWTARRHRCDRRGCCAFGYADRSCCSSLALRRRARRRHLGGRARGGADRHDRGGRRRGGRLRPRLGLRGRAEPHRHQRACRRAGRALPRERRHRGGAVAGRQVVPGRGWSRSMPEARPGADRGARACACRRWRCTPGRRTRARRWSRWAIRATSISPPRARRRTSSRRRRRCDRRACSAAGAA